MALITAACSPGHDVPLYNLWVVNAASGARAIVLGNSPEGGSTQPALLIPADGRPRSTYGASIGSQVGATGAVLVYDLDCTLVARVEVKVGSYLLTLGDGEPVLAELARSTEPTGAELAADAPMNCPGGAPP